MFALHDSINTRNCSGYRRRDFLRIGTCGLTGMTLADQLAGQAFAERSVYTGRSVVLLFLCGGPPHLEFFDPKMDAPSEIHSVTGEISTSLPGISFGSTFPKLAAMADRFSIVRSYGSGNSGHTYGGVVSGNLASGSSAGAILSLIHI